MYKSSIPTSLPSSHPTTISQPHSHPDNTTINRKMRKIQMMLNSLRQDQEDQMLHLQNLMAKGIEVENQVKTRINQCEQLKNFIKVGNGKQLLFEQNDTNNILPLKGLSLESKRRCQVDDQPLKRMRTSISPDFYEYKFRSRMNNQVEKKELRVKRNQSFKQEDRLAKLADIVHTQIEGLKVKEKQREREVQKQKKREKQVIRERNIMTDSRKRSEKSKIEVKDLTQVMKMRDSRSNKKKESKSEESKSITTKLIIIFALGLLFGLFTYL